METLQIKPKIKLMLSIKIIHHSFLINHSYSRFLTALVRIFGVLTKINDRKN